MKVGINDRTMRLLLAAYGASALLHADRVPTWCVVAAGIAVLWRLAQQRGWIALPGGLLRIGLALLLTASIFLTFRAFTGLAAGSALLLAMGAVKLLETRNTRDAVVVVTVALVLLLAACLERGNLPRLPLYALSGWISLSALAALGSRDSMPMRQAFAESGRALLWGLPLALLLFLFVPRLPGALWSLPGSGGAHTGLDDQMSPGSITQLALSDEPAFRVRFVSGRLPPPAQLYWRGPVLHHFDGATWTRGPFGVRQPVDAQGPAVEYQVILEPSGRNWWFGLESVDQVSRPGVAITWDGQLFSFSPVTSTLFYAARSYPLVRTRGPLPITTRRTDTQLVPGRNPRTLQLAARLHGEAGNDSAYVERVLDLLRTGGFRYTLTPAALGPEPVDSLLFDTREGFCGHFASAFVVLMRAAGVPARVVTGYLGGDWNGIGDYLLVRQSAAHAWAEVWLEDRGWVRVDPTAVVTPGRLERGLDDLLPEMGSASRWRHDSPFFRNLFAGWDAANYWWQERVLNFNLAAQQDLLSRLGIPDADYRTLAFLLLGGAALWTMVAFWLLARRAPRMRDADPLARIWDALRDSARRHGLALAGHEPPRTVARRVGAAWPAAAPTMARFAEDYLRLRFGVHPAAPDALRDLRRQLHRLRRVLRASHPAPDGRPESR